MERVLKKQPDAPPPEHYAVVVISDLHLGTLFGAGEALCEFLHNVRCDKLILNGDIVDGRHLNHRRPKELPERQKRVLDAINRKIAEGTEVIYIPGNHDIALRRLDVAGNSIEGVRIEKSLDLKDAKGRRFFVVHGDRFDKREELAERMPDWQLALLGRMNEAMTRGSRLLDKITMKTIKVRFNIAGRIRSAFEGDKHRHAEIERKALAHARENGYDGVVMGHTHDAACRMRDGRLYLNSGDWVDSDTALALDKDGNWSSIKWRERRKELGLRHSFRFAANDNPDGEFRPATERMIAAINTLWPGKQRKKKPSPPAPQ